MVFSKRDLDILNGLRTRIPLDRITNDTFFLLTDNFVGH